MSRPCPPLVLCGWALFCVRAFGLVLLLSCGRALPCPLSLSRALNSVSVAWALCPGLVLCGWALCPGLVLLLSSVAGLCGWALSSSCRLGRAPARLTGQECGRTNSDVNADKKFIDEAVCSWDEGRAYQEIVWGLWLYNSYRSSSWKVRRMY